MDKISAVGEKIKAAGYDSAGNAKVKAVYKKAVAKLRLKKSEKRVSTQDNSND